MPHWDPKLDTLIIDTVGAMVVVTDNVGNIIRFNEGGQRIMGYSEAQVLGRPIWEVFPPPELRARTHERFRKLAAGAAMQIDAVWLTRDGQRRHLSCSCIGVTDQAGRVEYTIGSGIDVTARVVAEETLRESEERFRTTFDNAAIGIALVNEQGRYLQVNRAFCELTGYSEKELLERDLFSITHPEDRDYNSRLIHSVASGDRQAYVMEKRYIRRSGEPVWVKVSASIASGGHGTPATIIGLFENISRRKADREALEEAYAREQALNETLERRVQLRTAELKMIVESMGDGVLVADKEGRLTMMNPAAERISGTLPLGMDLLNVRALQPYFFKGDGVTRCLPEELPLVRSIRGENVDDSEVLVRRPGANEVWTSATARPLRNESGELNGAVVVVRDMTDRKRHEAELEGANASLRKSEEHYKELAESHLRLAREVEHRVRNNLQGLLGLVSVMRDRATDVRSFADAIESRLAAMKHVHEMLAQTRWKGVGLRSLVDGALRTLQHMACEATEMGIDGPNVFISSRQLLPLTMVIVEWFTNSCKYGAHSVKGGSVQIRWELVGHTVPPRVRLRWTERGGPVIQPPIKPSLGTELVTGFVRRELAGTVELRYPPEGVDHILEFTLREDAAGPPESNGA